MRLSTWLRAVGFIIYQWVAANQHCFGYSPNHRIRNIHFWAPLHLIVEIFRCYLLNYQHASIVSSSSIYSDHLILRTTRLHNYCTFRKLSYQLLHCTLHCIVVQVISVVVMMVMVIWDWMKVVIGCIGINLWRSIFVADTAAPTAATSPRTCPIHQFRHKSDVGNGQSQGLNPWQSLLISKSWNFPTELVESFVQVEHPSAFPNIGRPSLGDWGYSTPCFLRRRRATAGTTSVTTDSRGNTLADHRVHLTSGPKS